MNLYKNAGIFIIAGLCCCACDFTDPEEYTFRSADQIKSNMNYLPPLRAAAYVNLPQGYNTIGRSWLAAACDEAEEITVSEQIQNFNIGNWNLYTNPDNTWSTNYAGIRNANNFTQLTNDVTWEEFRLSNPTAYADRVYRTKMWRNEMFFLRAFYYFELVKRYAGVPLVTEKLDVNKDADMIIKMNRASFSECIQYITDQCDTAANKLVVTQLLADAGAPTKGAALALKARTLLYAASDLFNKSGNNDPVLGYTDNNRQQRWIKAAEAAWEVIKMAPATYQLNSSYPALFTLGSAQSREVIFERRMGLLNTFEAANYSIGFNGGGTGTCPTQNLVDAYEMKSDGYSFDWNDPNQKANPYTDRDPRLAMTVVTNNTTFNGRVIEIWEGGKDGNPIYKTSKTGYYLKKYVIPGLDLTKDEQSYHQWIYFRLAEMYLNYAEAMNEAYGPDYTDGTLTMSARDAVNMVRNRSDVKMPEFPVGMMPDEFRTKLRNERRVELAFEDHRYWDVRRWNLGASVIGGTINGVKVAKVNDTEFNYTPFVVETRVFEPKMDLYPIPADEIIKSGGNIKQNPNW
jgi:hypothetical protein